MVEINNSYFTTTVHFEHSKLNLFSLSCIKSNALKLYYFHLRVANTICHIFNL